MPAHLVSLEVPQPADRVFDFLARPANLVQLMPPETRLELVEGPPRIALGTLLHWKAWRMGISQRLVNEVTAFEESVLVVEEQRHGPFRSWSFVHRFEATATGTRLVEEVQYEPPGGLLGLFLSEATIQKEIETLFAFRIEQMRRLWSAAI
jgi:ligand-binding SRPBCC domain-containing protein